MVLFRRIRKGDPLSRAVSSEDINKVYDILEGIEGIGCSVNKTPSGRGWTISVEEGGGGAGESIDFPWRVSVSGGYITMTPGRTLDLVSGATSTHSLTSVPAADGYVYAVYQSQGNGGLSVGFGAALPTPSSGEIVFAIADISGGAVTQYVVGLLPLARVTAETV